MTRLDRDRHHRRSIRLKDYDYAQAGAYFVTLCTHGRECLFGHIADGVMLADTHGDIALECWLALAQHFPDVGLDEFILMPNHVHGILVILDPDTTGRGAQGVDATRDGGAGIVGARLNGRGAACCAPTKNRGDAPMPKPGSLGAMVRSYKSAVTKRINEGRDTVGAPVWQRNYYEHIIRSERELNAIRHYIANNPANWQLDGDNPTNSARLPPPANVDDYVRDAGMREAGA